MQRLREAWFEYDGVKSGQMGLRLTKLPDRSAPARCGERAAVPGRDGFLWIDGGAYETLTIEAECETMDGFDLGAFREWLGRGEKRLVFSDDPQRAYLARVIDGAAAEYAQACYDRQVVRIRFVCQPFRYHYPEAGEIVLTAAGTVNNPGTALSLPRIKVEAAGDFMLMIGGELIEVTGGSIIIDSDLYDCYSADGALLANSRVRLDEYPVLLPGPNAVSWSGSVTSVTITPRWRDV